MDIIWSFVFLMASPFVYLLPGIIAASRKHHNAAAIFILNLLLGWTVLGWIASLVWATTSVDRRK